MDEHFRLTPYRDGDEREILALFERVFGGRREPEHWQWKFGRNPYGPPRAMLARETTTDRLIGQYAVMHVALNVMGRRVQAAQSLDTMVHPDHRMHGIFEASARACFDQLRQEGCALVYGFPNRSSFPGFVRKLGWTRVAFQASYSLKLSIHDMLRRRVHLPVVPSLGNAVFHLYERAKLSAHKRLAGLNSPGWQVRTSDRVPPHYEELWNAVKSFEILSIWKDSQYFAWRYDDNPSYTFTYHYVEREDVIDALCVAIVTNGVCRVVELIVRNQSVDLARYLIASVGLHALGAGAARLVFTGATLDFFDEVFRGFDRDVKFGHVFCLIELSHELPAAATDAKNWTTTEGDCDAF